MVAVLTAALVTAAEISNLFSALGVIVCLICMVIFILRVNDEDIFGTSVVHVAQPPVAQVSYQKVAVPFSLELHKPSDTTYSDVQLKIRSDVSYAFRSYWGVMSDQLQSLIGGPWSGFFVDLLDNTHLGAEVVGEGSRFESCEEFEFKGVGLDQEPSSLDLGPMPRKKYPLVVCMVRQDTVAEDADPSSVGALITIIHIKDSECQVPTCILYQYLKQYSGQLTRLQALYTQGKSTASSNESPVSAESSNTEVEDYSVGGHNSGDEEEIPLEEACVVCQTNRITRALLPCRHVCVCSSCCERLETCPMCRARFLAYFLISPEPEEPISDDSEESEEELRSTWQRMSDTVSNWLRLEF